VIRKRPAHHRTRRHDRVLAKCGPRKNDDVRAKPATRANTYGSFRWLLPTNGRIDVLVGVILIGDVHVGTSLYLIAEMDGPVSDDVRTTPDDAALANTHDGRGQHLLIGANARRETDVGPNEHFVANGEVTLVVNHALRGEQRGARPEVIKTTSVVLVRAHSGDFVGVGAGSSNPGAESSTKAQADTHASHATGRWSSLPSRV